MKYFAIILMLVAFNGCVYFNEEGISKDRYRECVEYYDAQGKYKVECKKNLIDYDDIPEKLLK